MPMAGLRSLNPDVVCHKFGFPGSKLYLPQTCTVAVVDEFMSVQDFVASGALPGTVSLLQFLRWNIFLSSGDDLWRGNTVCIECVAYPADRLSGLLTTLQT